MMKQESPGFYLLGLLVFLIPNYSLKSIFFFFLTFTQVCFWPDVLYFLVSVISLDYNFFCNIYTPGSV